MAALGVRGTQTVCSYNVIQKAFTCGGVTGKALLAPLPKNVPGGKITSSMLNKVITKKNPEVITLNRSFFSSIQKTAEGIEKFHR